MSAILNLTLPFFALVGLGYFAAWRHWLPENGVRSINVFAFNFAMPALVINALARQDAEALFNGPFLVGWLLAALALFGLGAIVAKVLFGASRAEMALFGQASAIGNLGFLALPLLIAAVGSEVAAPVSAALIIDLVIIIPLSIAILESAKGEGGSAAKAVGNALKGAVKNPFFIAIAIGVFLAVSGIGLPGATSTFIAFLAGAAGPAALFTLGASLAGRPTGSDWATIGAMSVFKLLVHPIVVAVSLTLMGVDGLFLAVGIVLSAMPIAGNVFVIAEAYGTMVRRLATAILISTIIAVVTVAAALEWVGLA